MEAEKFKEKFSTDDSYLSYIVRRFLSVGSFDLITIEMDLPLDTFDQMFAEAPEVEDRFIERLSEISEKQLMYATKAAMKAAMKELHRYLGNVDPTDEKASIQACSAILNYHARQYPRVKVIDDEDEIDKIYKRLIKDARSEKNTGDSTRASKKV